MSTSEVACSYAAMILHDDGIPITAEKIATLLKSANVQVESYWPGLFAKLTEKKDVGDLIMATPAVGSAPASVAMAAPAAAASATPPAVEEKKEEPEEGSDDDMPLFDLFE